MTLNPPSCTDNPMSNHKVNPSPPDTLSHKKTTNDISVLYTNADQLLNKINDLEMLIAGNEPNLILITEILPKNHLYLLNKACLMIPGYSLYLNFDPDIDTTSNLGFVV